MRGDTAIAGVIYAPALDEMYWGIYDNGAYSEINGEIVKMEVSTYNKSDKGLKLVCSRSHLNEATQAIRCLFALLYHLGDSQNAFGELPGLLCGRLLCTSI